MRYNKIMLLDILSKLYFKIIWVPHHQRKQRIKIKCFNSKKLSLSFSSVTKMVIKRKCFHFLCLLFQRKSWKIKKRKRKSFSPFERISTSLSSFFFSYIKTFWIISSLVFCYDMFRVYSSELSLYIIQNVSRKRNKKARGIFFLQQKSIETKHFQNREVPTTLFTHWKGFSYSHTKYLSKKNVTTIRYGFPYIV